MGWPGFWFGKKKLKEQPEGEMQTQPNLPPPKIDTDTIFQRKRKRSFMLPTEREAIRKG